jgi:CTP synthase
VVCRELGLKTPPPDLGEWRKLAQKISYRQKRITVAIVGKYVKLHDAYLSIIESLNHAGFETGADIKIKWIDSEEVTEASVREHLCDVDALIIPGGFGDRGIEGKIAACRFARENNLPFLGICLGMQIAVIEFSRNVCGLLDANSSEFDENSSQPVIDLMPDQRGIVNKGGTMRLGAYPCAVKEGTLMMSLYGSKEISERHRHRFEFNNSYREQVEKAGLKICGTSPDNLLVEAIELPGNKFFIGVQFHPEFKSRPNRPHPLFLGLLRASLEKKKKLRTD